MSAVPIIIQALLAAPTVTAVVSTRIRPISADQGGTPPDLVIYAASEADAYELAGAMEFPAARVTVECRARTFSAADTLGDKVIAALQNLNGTFDGKHAQVFGWSQVASDHDDEFSIFRRVLDFHVRYRVV